MQFCFLLYRIVKEKEYSKGAARFLQRLCCI